MGYFNASQGLWLVCMMVLTSGNPVTESAFNSLFNVTRLLLSCIVLG